MTDTLLLRWWEFHGSPRVTGGQGAEYMHTPMHTPVHTWVCVE